MSNIAVKGATTGTGTFTLESPATNTDRTLTIPDVDGTIVTADASGNVGIGTSSPTAKLQINASEAIRLTDANPYISFYDPTNTTRLGFLQIRESSSARLWVGADQPLVFATNNAERMIIDSAGRVTTPYQPAFYCYWASASHQYFSSPGGVIQFDTKALDVTSSFNTSNGVFTAPVAGKYFFSYSTLAFSAATYVAVRKNGATFPGAIAYWDGTGTYGNLHLTCVVPLAVGDTMDFFCNYGGCYSNYISCSGYMLG